MVRPKDPVDDLSYIVQWRAQSHLRCGYSYSSGRFGWTELAKSGKSSVSLPFFDSIRAQCRYMNLMEKTWWIY